MRLSDSTRRRARNWLLLPGLLALAMSACREQPPPAVVAAAPKSAADHFDVRLGDRVVHLQFAVLDPEMHRGLMERRNLGSNEGMLFAYDSPQQLDFWMRDTPTALDVGYFTPAGELAEIYPLLPFDERPVPSRRNDLQFAVEMASGWYEANGIRPGARLEMAAVAAGLRARGFDPRKYGLGPP